MPFQKRGAFHAAVSGFTPTKGTFEDFNQHFGKLFPEIREYYKGKQEDEEPNVSNMNVQRMDVQQIIQHNTEDSGG